jgi:NADH-quinone oxidoreductase subunit N
MAIPQKNVKRLLAYSTISQAGYILVGFVGASVIGISSVIFYLLAYTVTNIAAFAVVTAFSKATGSDNLDDYAGLAQKEPLLALLFMLSLLSLAGIPPLAGFVGKFYLFYSAMQKGYVWLVVAAALNSTISLYYYLLILKQMYIFDRKKEFPKIKIDFSVKIVLIFTMIVIFIMGIFPGPVLDLTTDIAQSLFFK